MKNLNRYIKTKNIEWLLSFTRKNVSNSRPMVTSISVVYYNSMPINDRISLKGHLYS